MEKMKNRQLALFMVGIATLVLLNYNATAVYGHSGGGHHAEYAHMHHDRGEHMHDGTNSVRHYHHDHDDYGDHYHNCRNIPGESSKGADNNILSEQECQKHGGEWELSGN